MATTRIQYSDKTDATPSNAAQWTGPDVNEVKAVVNNNADEVDTNASSISDNANNISIRLENALGDFNPLTFTFSQSGYYNDYTMSGDVTLDPQGTPTINIWQKVTIITDGTHTLTKSVNSVMYNHISGNTLPSGAYDIWITTVGGKYYYNVQQNDSDVTKPRMLSFTMASDNTYADLLFDEGIYGAADGVTPAVLADFNTIFVQNGDTATGWTVTSVRQNDSVTEGSASALAGGETTIRFFGVLQGSTTGLATVTVSPTDGNSLFDVAGNAMDAAQSEQTTLQSGWTPADLGADLLFDGTAQDAGGGKAGSIDDQSGNFTGVNPVQATDSLRPTYQAGPPITATFNGTSHYLDSNSFAQLIQTSGNITYVHNVTTLNARVVSFFDAAEQSRYCSVGMGNSSEPVIASRNDAQNNVITFDGAALQTGDIVTFQSTGTAYRCFVNGVERNATAAGGADDGQWIGDITNVSNWSIGRLRSDNPAYYAFVIDKLYIHNVTTDQDIINLHNYIAAL